MGFAPSSSRAVAPGGESVFKPCHIHRKGDAVIKLDIINEVVNKTGITKIELRGFGIFNVRPRKTGIGRNPRTGAEVAIPPGKAVRFKPGKELQSLQ
jgi:nucleoid DNA-binding protein